MGDESPPCYGVVMEKRIKSELDQLKRAHAEKIDFLKQLQNTFGQTEREIEKITRAIEILEKLLEKDAPDFE